MIRTRRDKLVRLADLMNLETQTLKLEKFQREQTLFIRSGQFKLNRDRIRACDKCDGMNQTCFTESCPGYGNLMSPVVLVGISPGTPCMASQIPFTGGSGYLLDAALRLSGLTREDIFITNIIQCHPHKNRSPKASEIENCMPYLIRQLKIIKPHLVISLGKIPRTIIEDFSLAEELGFKLLSVKHPASFLHASNIGSKGWIISMSNHLDRAFGSKGKSK